MQRDSVYTFLVYKDEENLFTGICLENDIIIEHLSSPEEALASIARKVAITITAAKNICVEKGLTLAFSVAAKKYWDLAGKIYPEKN